MKSTLFLVIFALSSGIFQLAEAKNDSPHITLREQIISTCVQPAHRANIVQCINEQFQNVLAAEGLIEQRFKQDLKKLVEARGLNHFNLQKVRPMSAFNVSITQARDLEFHTNCFAFERLWLDKRLKDALRPVLNAMFESALFLKHVHVLSLGRPASLLFQIRRIELCHIDQSLREIDFENGVLFIGIDPDDNSDDDRKRLTASRLLSEWNNGAAVAPHQKKNLAKKISDLMERKLTEADVQEMISDRWALLNPVGLIRRNLRIVVLGKILPYLATLRKNHEITSPAAQLRHLQNLARHPGFRDDMRQVLARATPEQGADFFARMEEKMQEQLFISKIVSDLFTRSSQYCKGPRNTIVAERVQEGKYVNFMNAKNIGVDLSFIGANRSHELFMSEEKPSEELMRECGGNVQVRDVQKGANGEPALVNVNPIDNIQVNVQLPSRFGERTSQMALYDVLEEHLER